MIDLKVPPCTLALHPACRLIIPCFNHYATPGSNARRGICDQLTRPFNVLHDIPECYDIKEFVLIQIGNTAGLKS